VVVLLSSARQIDRFDLLIPFQAFRPADAADAGLLVAAERRVDLKVQSVDGHIAGPDSPGQRQTPFRVLGKDRATQTVAAVIGYADSVFLVAKEFQARLEAL